ncbi:MAG: hypothetical protein ACOXZR_00090 [Bacilli bacterium]|jgi:hypothetical protein
MKKINLTENELNKLSSFVVGGYNIGGNIYQFDEETLLKIYDSNYSPIAIRENNIDYLINIAKIDNAILPLEKVYINDKFRGFRMWEVKEAKRLYEVIEDDSLNINKRIKYARTLLKTLKEIQKNNIVLGDIHLDNFIHNEKDVYFVDMDGIRNGDLYTQSLYYIQPTTKESHLRWEDKNTDNAKMALIFLSLLYKVNYEKPIREKETSYCNLEELGNKLPSHLKEALYFSNINLGGYLEYLISEVKSERYERDREKVLDIKKSKR